MRYSPSLRALGNARCIESAARFQITLQQQQQHTAVHATLLAVSTRLRRLCTPSGLRLTTCKQEAGV